MNGDGRGTVVDRATLMAWARAQGVRVRVACEDWESITYETLSRQQDGTSLVQRHRCVLPEPVTRRRLLMSYVVGLSHGVDGAECNHVRRIVPPVLSSTDKAARHDVALVAAALVEVERRAVCGATVDNLRVYTVERAVHWRPF
ncbi:hypothetical protein [Nocardiopsis sp. CNT312]|uniref:hypothetical protein n=1 Tax=Nocardiopsis sp. CNT312 TaxID=1137268 RepID=UPI0004907838|nr:hypothetical protein [Nocardiopsis sp. CNT312]